MMAMCLCRRRVSQLGKPVQRIRTAVPWLKTMADCSIYAGQPEMLSRDENAHGSQPQPEFSVTHVVQSQSLQLAAVVQ